ncbi:MAG: hypothetical protein Q6J46_05345, partial [Thermostichus sp. DG02_2_bins_29]
MPSETNTQNWSLHRVGDTFSSGSGLLRGINRAKAGSLKLVRSRKGIGYACISVSMEVPDAEDTGCCIGVERGQNV